MKVSVMRSVRYRRKGNWYQLAQKVWELDPGVRKTFFTNFIVNASLKGSALQKETEEKRRL